jgi:hypothetical protein
MDLTQIKSIVKINLKGVPSTSYTWNVTKINSTSYRVNIYTTVSLNEMSMELTFLKPDLVIDSKGTVL